MPTLNIMTNGGCMLDLVAAPGATPIAELLGASLHSTPAAARAHAHLPSAGARAANRPSASAG